MALALLGRLVYSRKRRATTARLKLPLLRKRFSTADAIQLAAQSLRICTALAKNVSAARGADQDMRDASRHGTTVANALLNVHASVQRSQAAAKEAYDACSVAQKSLEDDMTAIAKATENWMSSK